MTDSLLELMMENMGNLVLIFLILFLILLVLFSKFYQRSSKDVAFVRTGMGGEKIVLTSGAMAIPIIHQVTPVNMNTLRLNVERSNEKGLITLDKMRIDIQSAFYVRVKGDKDGVALAAQTLGARTLNPQSIQELLEGKFVDAIRSVAASMSLEEIHSEGRGFTDRVAKLVDDVVTKNGLELESVSLSSMDQTDKQYLDPSNTFDAVGLIKVTRETEESRRTRNEIEKNADLKIAQTNLDVEKKNLNIKRESEYSRLQTDLDVTTKQTEQTAKITIIKAIKQKEASEVEIAQKEETEKNQLASEKTIKQERTLTEKAIRNAEIEKAKVLEKTEIDRSKEIKIAEKNKEIDLLKKEQEVVQARDETSKIEVQAVEAEEEVSRRREVAIAEKEKAVSLIRALRTAEEKAVAITGSADSEKLAAADLAEARKITSDAEANAIREELTARAEGQQRINESANILSDEQISMQVKLKIVDQLPDIISESVKPMQNIKDIKIIDVNGLAIDGSKRIDTAKSEGSVTNGDVQERDLVDRAVTGALRYRAQAPVLDSLLKEVGLISGDESLEDLATGKSFETLNKTGTSKKKSED
tara:strand:+ start:243 stop:2003 length:1761 start_codon:yes stop_codon:yes gene_type:complete